MSNHNSEYRSASSHQSRYVAQCPHTYCESQSHPSQNACFNASNFSTNPVNGNYQSNVAQSSQNIWHRQPLSSSSLFAPFQPESMNQQFVQQQQNYSNDAQRPFLPTTYEGDSNRNSIRQHLQLPSVDHSAFAVLGQGPQHAYALQPSSAGMLLEPLASSFMAPTAAIPLAVNSQLLQQLPGQ